MKRWIKPMGFAIGMAATAAFIWYALHALQGRDLSAYATPRALEGLALCVLFYMTNVPLAAWAWRRLLAWRNVQSETSVLVRILAVSQMGKYIPGNVGAHLGRAALGASAGIPMRALVGTMVAEAGLIAYASLAVAGVCMLVFAPGKFTPGLGCLLVLLLVAPLGVRRLMGKRLSWLPSTLVMGQVVGAYAAVYMAVGMGMWLLASVALPAQSHPLALLCASFALSWIAGFFTPGAPAGLGVREGVMLSLLQNAYSTPDALFLVIGLRLATVAGDAILFLLGNLGLLLHPLRPSSDHTPEPAMQMTLEPTGERMIEEHYLSSPQDHVIHLMHLATYRFAEPFVRGKRVLDYGCGSGYGSARMSQLAQSVVGVDVAPDAVAYAAERFPAPNLAFQVIDPSASLPFADASFDTVLSFQVFEHVADTASYLSEIRRVLVPGGTLLLATPDRSTRLLPGQRPWNRWHLHEYAATELEQVLGKHFPTVEMLGMGGKPEVLRIEIDRCTKVKWLTLPFTLPFLPDSLRVAGLNLIHRLRGQQARAGTPTVCPFSIDDIEIRKGIAPSVNLVAIARADFNHPELTSP